MGEISQLHILKQGADAWNRWREDHPDIIPELADVNLEGHGLRGYNFRGAKFFRVLMQGADLRDADFEGAFVKETLLTRSRVEGANFKGVSFYQSRLIEVDLSRSEFGGTYFGSALMWRADLSRRDLRAANFNRADLEGAKLVESNLSGASLEGTNLTNAILIDARLKGASLVSASLHGANLMDADLSGADLTGASMVGTLLNGANLSGASLQAAVLINTDLRDAILTGSRVFGISAWNLFLDGARQDNIVITPAREAAITCDDIEVAQFIFLLLRNEKVRQIIDTVTSKTVLILGRFSEERKPVLDAIRQELRRRNFTPILFDFDRPSSKDVTGTVETLARLARFIIADLTDPSSIPHELATVVPFLRTTPVLPIRLEGAGGYSMFDDLARAYPWVLQVHPYADSASLIARLPEMISPADRMAESLRQRV